MEKKEIDLSEFPEDLKTGIIEIDRQHMTLLLMIDDLITHTDENKEQSVADMVMFLKSYVDIHFKTEEEYMIKAGYKDFEQHKQIHDGFITEVEDLHRKLSDPIDRIMLTEETINSVKDWVINHVKHTDIQMAKFLKESE